MAIKYRVLGLLWLMQLVNYLDRINISIAAPTMMKDLAITPGHFGFVLAAFTLGYAIMQIPGGALADRFGSKRVLIGSALVWGCFTGLTGFASSLATLIAARVGFGLSEGASNGPAFKLVGDYFTSASAPAPTGPTSPRSLWARPRRPHGRLDARPRRLARHVLPLRHPRRANGRPPRRGHAAREFRYRHPHRNPHPHRQAGRLGDVMRLRSPWLLFFAYMAFNMAFWGYLGWMPSYLSLARHIDLKELGVAASIPYVFGFFGMVVFGWLGSRPFYRHRALLVGAAYLLAGLGLYAAFQAATPYGASPGSRWRPSSSMAASARSGASRLISRPRPRAARFPASSIAAARSAGFRADRASGSSSPIPAASPAGSCS